MTAISSGTCSPPLHCSGQFYLLCLQPESVPEPFAAGMSPSPRWDPCRLHAWSGCPINTSDSHRTETPCVTALPLTVSGADHPAKTAVLPFCILPNSSKVVTHVPNCAAFHSCSRFVHRGLPFGSIRFPSVSFGFLRFPSVPFGSRAFPSVPFGSLRPLPPSPSKPHIGAAFASLHEPYCFNPYRLFSCVGTFWSK